MIDKHKFSISTCLWIVSSLLGVIPIFFEYVDWYLDCKATYASDILEKLVSTDDFYFGLASVLLVSLIELVLETGNKYYPLVFINVIFDIIILVVYNLSYFKPDFIIRVLSSSNKVVAIGWFVGIVSIVSVIISIINILFLSFISPKGNNDKMHTMQLSRVKVY